MTTFKPWNKLTAEQKAAAIEPMRVRKAAYQTAFSGNAGEAVLADLRKFCRAEKSCFDADPRLHAVLEGRREVFLRIMEHHNLGLEELAELYGAVVPVRVADGDQIEEEMT